MPLAMHPSRHPTFRLLPALVVVLATTLGAAEFTLLPLGDSITDGNPSGGYRSKMMADLTAAGHTVHLLGSQTMDPEKASPSLKPPHDGLRHEGHGGWRIDQLDEHLDGNTNIDAGGNGGHFLTGGHGTGREVIRPDFITVLAGINDVNQYFGSREQAKAVMKEDEILPLLQKRMTSLVTRLHRMSPDSHLLLGTVLPYANGLLDDRVTGATETQRRAWAKEDGVNPAQEAGVNHFVIRFNRWLAGTFVPEMQEAGIPITLVDQYRNFILEDGSVRGWGPEAPDGFGDFGLHPNPYGYDLMGGTWARAVEAVLERRR